MRERGFGPPLDDKLISFIEDVARARGLDTNKYAIELLTQDLEDILIESQMLERRFADEDPETRPFLGWGNGEAGQARFLLFELNMLEHKIVKRRRKSEQAAPAEPTGT